METRPPIDPAECPLCGANASRPAWGRAGDPYLRCGGCGAARLDPFVPEARQVRLFDRDYFEGGLPGGYLDYDADEPLHRQNARDRLADLARRRPAPPGRLLDVGCATGYFLDEARRAGWTVAGVDVSDHVRAVARRRFDLDVLPDLARALEDGPGRFDAVTFYQVLEHLAEPLVALRQARALLKPDGVLVIETWDLSSWIARLSGRHWQQANPPSVAWLFDRRSLGVLLDRAGFGPPATRATGKRVRAGFVLHLLAERMPAVLGPVERLAIRIGVDRAGFRYRLGDLVTAVAGPAPGRGGGAAG